MSYSRLPPVRFDSYWSRAAWSSLKPEAIEVGKLHLRWRAVPVLDLIACVSFVRPTLRVRDMVNPRSASIAALSACFLAGLEQPATDAILAAAHTRRIAAKRKITTEGCRATSLFLVQSGHARFYHLTKQGELILLERLAPGDVIGLAAMLKNPPPYMATAEATSECVVLAWEHSVIRQLASFHPLLAENGLRIALGYLRAYIERHTGLVTKSAEARLAETLLRLSDQSGQFHPEGIEIHATNEELGALADISPFTTSRVLRNWGRSGTISKERGRVLLHAPEALMTD